LLIFRIKVNINRKIQQFTNLKSFCDNFEFLIYKRIKKMESSHSISLWSGIPFVLMLGSIAVFPLVAEKFWESNRNKLIVALILGIPTAIWMIFNGMTNELEHSLIFDYVPFLILLGSLFIITGGIFVDGDIEATPRNNTILLALEQF
jgi:hypothetical protein